MKRNQVEKNAVIQDDLLRYTKNKLPASLALLALVFNILYFTLLYTIHTTQMYTIVVGVSVIVNLLVLLSGFYASEGIKAYNKKMCILLLVLAAVQIARIFIYPLQGLSDKWMAGNAYFGVIMTTGSNGALLIIYLVGSAACFIASAVLGYINTMKREAHLKKIESGELSIEDTLKELDEQDLAKETEEVSAPVVSEEVNNG